MGTWSECQSRLRYKYRKRTRTITSGLETTYLREDCSCCSEACSVCAPASHSSLAAGAPYLLIPDVDVLNDYLEVFEIPNISNYVLLSSVVRELNLRVSLRKINRLRALYRDVRRRCVLFDDLHCMWTCEAARGATPAPLAVAEYYYQHLGCSTPVVVVSDRLAGVDGMSTLQQLLQQLQLTDAQGPGSSSSSSTGPVSALSSASLTTIASGSSIISGGGRGAAMDQQHLHQQLLQQLRQQGVVVMPAAQYFASFWGHVPAVADLFDSLLQSKLAQSEEPASGAECGSGEATGAPHLSQQEIEEGLQQGTLLQGVLLVSKRSPHEGVVRVGGSSSGGLDGVIGRLIRVSGRAAINRVLNGDRVAVRLLESGHGGNRAAPGGAAGSTPAGAEESAAADEDDDAVAEDAAVAAAAEPGAAGGASGSAAAAAVGDGVDYGAELLAVEGGEEEGALAALNSLETSERLPLGEVVGIVQRDSQCVVACLTQADEAAILSRSAHGETHRQEAVLCVPVDRRLPYVRIRTRQAGRLVGQRFVLRIDGWPRGARYPDGHVVKVLGPMSDMGVAGQAVLEQCRITWQPFCEAALSELPAVPDPWTWRAPEAERAVRRDLTGPEYFVCSIDPVGCTDVDDALHVRLLPGGLVEVGVHIADVSYFVRPNSMLDGEARDRCTSVYLVDRRLDMLPSLLSEHLCSLRGGTERLAVSVIWTLDAATLELAGPESEAVWFGRTIIRSRHQLHYKQAQDVLDGLPPAPGDELSSADTEVLRQGLQVLSRLTAKLHAARIADGALELASAELRFQLDESGKPTAVISKQHIPMMDVVAEMMILANAAVAKRIATAFPGAALLRSHPPPREEAFEQVRPLLEPGSSGQQRVDPGSNRSLSAALRLACMKAGGGNSAAAQLLKSLVTRAMSEARYLSTGSAPPGSLGTYHYGLALQYYTHFTSPIRRYADVVVHRQLLAALAAEPAAAPAAGGAPPMPHAELSVAAERMNEQHRAAKGAQKSCAELYLLQLLHAVPHAEYAVVKGIEASRGSLEVFIPAYHLIGRVQLVDRKGRVRLPLTGDADKDAAMGSDDAFLDAERRSFALRCSPDDSSVGIIDIRTGQVLWEAHVGGSCWVLLAADTSRAHGPCLNMHLLATQHPMVAQAAVAAAAKQQQQQQQEVASPAPAAGAGAAAALTVQQRVLAAAAARSSAAAATAAPAASSGLEVQAQHAINSSTSSPPPPLQQQQQQQQQQHVGGSPDRPPRGKQFAQRRAGASRDSSQAGAGGDADASSSWAGSGALPLPLQAQQQPEPLPLPPLGSTLPLLGAQGVRGHSQSGGQEQQQQHEQQAAEGGSTWASEAGSAAIAGSAASTAPVAHPEQCVAVASLLRQLQAKAATYEARISAASLGSTAKLKWNSKLELVQQQISRLLAHAGSAGTGIASAAVASVLAGR